MCAQKKPQKRETQIEKKRVETGKAIGAIDSGNERVAMGKKGWNGAKAELDIGKLQK